MGATFRSTMKRSWTPTIIGGLFLSLLVTTLIVYDHVVLDSGPEALVGREIGEPCSDSEECSAALGSATRRAVPKVCVATRGRAGVCARSCGGALGCPDGWECVESRTLVGGATGEIPAHTCAPPPSRPARSDGAAGD